MTLTLRYMRLEDVPDVVAIDRMSFDPPWSARSYSYEISESNYSHMVVLEHAGDESAARGLRRFAERLGMAHAAAPALVGYGGLWHIVDEAHVSTIATHPDQRGRGYGEILLGGMVRRALTLGAGYIVLEVRVSNVTAQNLYKKWEFEVADVKPRYYHNNGEDAYDMRVDLRDAGRQQRIRDQFEALCKAAGLRDEYTETPPPRGQG